MGEKMRHAELLEELRKDPKYVATEEELRPFFEIANATLRLRLSKGWSQSRLAKEAGISKTTVSYLEYGIGNPTLNTISAIAIALGAELHLSLVPVPDKSTTK